MSENSLRMKTIPFPAETLMTIEQLKAAHSAVPFRPFTIRMADGRTFPVAHPEFMSRSQSGRTVAVSHGSDMTSILDLLLMTEIEFDDAASETGKGSRGRRRA